MFFAEPLSFPSQELTMCQQEQLQQRAAYLRQQRDKLQALKREQQRSKQGTPPEETPATPAAPPGEATAAVPVSAASSWSFLFETSLPPLIAQRGW